MAPHALLKGSLKEAKHHAIAPCRYILTSKGALVAASQKEAPPSATKATDKEDDRETKGGWRLS
jgi:C4-dicarboxylate-specific signal transduction histidine kinase